MVRSERREPCDRSKCRSDDSTDMEGNVCRHQLLRVLFPHRVVSFPGGQLSTEEGYGVLSQVVILLGQYCVSTTAGCIHLETEGAVIAWW